MCKGRGWGLLLILFFSFGVNARADNTACAGAIVLTPDGSIVESDFAGSQSRWFQFRGKADRSYAAMAEFIGPADGADAAITFSTPVSACGGSSVAAHNRTLMEPVGWLSASSNGGAAGAGRWAIKLAADQNLFFSWSASAAAAFRVRVVETTLFNPRWSTYGGFYTSWGFFNTANDEQGTVNVSVTLKVIANTGEVLATDTFSVPPNGVVFRSTTGLGIPASRAGIAIVTHDGLPGAILADGFMVSPDGLTGFPVKFEPRSPQK